MAGRRHDQVLESVREAVLQQRYILSPHAVFEMRQDSLDQVDVESAILTGRIERVFENDPRSTRYEIVGRACDLQTHVGVVARLVGEWLIITVYEVRE